MMLSSSKHPQRSRAHDRDFEPTACVGMVYFRAPMPRCLASPVTTGCQARDKQVRLGIHGLSSYRLNEARVRFSQVSLGAETPILPIAQGQSSHSANRNPTVLLRGYLDMPIEHLISCREVH